MKKSNLYPLIVASLVLLSIVDTACTQDKSGILDIQLKDPSGLTLEGPHRFMTVSGITGLHVSSLKTKAYIETTAFQNSRGTVSFWMSPLENIDKAPRGGASNLIYPFLSGIFPPASVDSSTFSVYYQGSHYPRVIGRFTDGSYWGQMDYGIAPVVYAEALPLQKGQWYHFVMTWDKGAQTMIMYINGELVGHNFAAKAFKQDGSRIYIGNPLMVISKLRIQPGVMTREKVRTEYMADRPATNDPADNTVRSIVNPVVNPAQELPLDQTWEKV